MLKVENGRIDGTTYPSEAAPPGSLPFPEPENSGLRARIGRRLIRLVFGIGVELLRAQPGDVMIIRAPTELRWHPGTLRELNQSVRAAGLSAAVVLPIDVLVHVEPSKLKREDRGYRETKTYGSDRPASNTDSRGVHTGVPGAERPVRPHPESEAS